MPTFDVPVAILPVLSFALQTIKEGVPSRYEKISKYLQEYATKNPAIMTSTTVKVSFDDSL